MSLFSKVKKSIKKVDKKLTGGRVTDTIKRTGKAVAPLAAPTPTVAGAVVGGGAGATAGAAIGSTLGQTLAGKGLGAKSDAIVAQEKLADAIEESNQIAAHQQQLAENDLDPAIGDARAAARATEGENQRTAPEPKQPGLLERAKTAWGNLPGPARIGAAALLGLLVVGGVYTVTRGR